MSEELNKYIHTVIMGKCGNHRPSRKGWKGEHEMPCEGGCGELIYWQAPPLPTPDYCSPDSPRRLLDEVEKVVVEKVGVRYLQALIDTVEFAESSDLFALNWAIATPEQRATACRRAWEGEGI